MTAEEKEERSPWASPAWFPLGTYNKGDVVWYGEASWSPPESPNLWKRIR